MSTTDDPFCGCGRKLECQRCLKWMEEPDNDYCIRCGTKHNLYPCNDCQAEDAALFNENHLKAKSEEGYYSMMRYVMALIVVVIGWIYIQSQWYSLLHNLPLIVVCPCLLAAAFVNVVKWRTGILDEPPITQNAH